MMNIARGSTCNFVSQVFSILKCIHASGLKRNTLRPRNKILFMDFVPCSFGFAAKGYTSCHNEAAVISCLVIIIENYILFLIKQFNF